MGASMGDDEVGGFDAGEPFVADAAPSVEPNEPLKVPAPALQPVTAKWVEEQLHEGTAHLHELLGERARADLRVTDLEAGLMAPGLARYLNSRPAAIAAVQGPAADYLKLGAGSTLYGLRIAGERREDDPDVDVVDEAAREQAAAAFKERLQ